MHPIQAVITAWPFSTAQLDPVVFFRESPLRFQGLLDGDELLELLQRGAITAIEYVMPHPTGSCMSQFVIRYVGGFDGGQFAVSSVGDGLAPSAPVLRSARRDEIAAWLRHRVEAASAAALSSVSSAPGVNPMRAPIASAPAQPTRFMVAYIRAEERRRAGYSVRAAYAYRKSHPELRLPTSQEQGASPAHAGIDAPAAHDDPGSAKPLADRIDDLLARLASGELHAVAYGDRDNPHADGLGLRVTFKATASAGQFIVRTREMEFEGRSLCFAANQREAVKTTLARLIDDFEKLERALARLRDPADPRMSRIARPVHRLYAIAHAEGEGERFPRRPPRARQMQGQR